jgi:PmbA protein
VPKTPAKPVDILENLIAKARSAGADAADAVYVSRESQSVSVRLGVQESLDRSETADLGLRVFIGKSQAFSASSDLSARALDGMVRAAIDMAKASPADQYAGLAPEDRLYQSESGGEDLADIQRPTAQDDIERALETEAAARAVEGVTNSQGASAGWSASHIALATSHGFLGEKHSTSYSLSAAVLAKSDAGMERDYASSTKRFFEDMESPQDVGEKAGKRTVARLNPKTLKTGPMPIVFDRRVSSGLISQFASAINASSIARGTSFLRTKMGEQIFAPGITITDDPHRPRGLRTRLFDGEGVATKPINLIEDGVLQSWLLESATARQLGLETTGHAARGTTGPPSPSASNLYLAAGDTCFDDLLSDIKTGFYVTEMIGMGVNPVTGDYSRGASGFAILDGAIAHPVSGLTVAGNLVDMFSALTPADDLEFRYGTDAPTVRIEGMTVAGEA